MPFRNNQFDVVISSQVLQHIPSPRHRTAFISELARTLKPGGQLVLSVYNWSRDAQLEGKPREGFHNGRIYFHCFDPDELRAVLSSAFQVQSIRGVQVIFPKTYRLFTALGKRNIYWDRFWQPREIALRYGRLLVAVCKAG
jgi:2-polyprenyl-3-methyl-5-hydroxy-6-metoxy-1,4-benzoquinol methylase